MKIIANKASNQTASNGLKKQAIKRLPGTLIAALSIRK